MSGTITHKWNGTQLVITSDSGTSAMDLRGEKGDTGIRGAQGIAGGAGARGEKGDRGEPFRYEDFTAEQLAALKGADGNSPNITVEKVGKVATITVTDSNGTQTVIINDGADGAKGDRGADGARGATGERGADGKDGLDATPVAPLFANSIGECEDTSKFYVLPDGYIYAYMKREVAGGAAYTNQVPISTDTDGTRYNGVGYKEGVRLSSSGGVSSEAQAGSVTTGFIPFKNTDIIRIKGAIWLNTTGHYYVNLYNANKAFITNGNMSAQAYSTDYSSQVSVTYDEATNTTTIQFINPNETTGYYRQAAKTAAYIRLNAYGSGKDLIVTVNEEIKEAAATTVYEWTNTGHAFIPADYEERIIELEEDNAAIESNITELNRLVDEILDGTTNIKASSNFDATVYDLPVLYLTGDISPVKVNKDNKVNLDYSYEGRSGTCKLKGQGATSYKLAQQLGDKGKFNYTITFDNPFEAATGWGEQKKYCLKANWIDTTHSRNIVSAKLWGLIAKSRSNLPTELKNLPNAGAVDGFPIVIMLNNEFHGLYTFNIPKDGWMFGLVEDTSKTQAIVGANDHETATQFKGELAGDESDFELEFVSDEDSAAWVTTSLNRLINACRNSNGTDLDTTVAQYLDWQSVIDYYIWVVVCKGTDMVDKNYLLMTLNGTKWYFSAYDMDSTYGLNWDGTGLSRAVSNVTFQECADTHRAYELIKNYKKAELKARYKELRSNILSETRICNYFENFAWAIPLPVLLEDIKKYPSIMGSRVNDINQICRWVRQRLEVVDKWIEEL